MRKIERAIDRALRLAERRLNTQAREAKTDGTTWDWAYALGKRNGLRMAREIVTGEDQAHHSKTFERVEEDPYE